MTTCHKPKSGRIWGSWAANIVPFLNGTIQSAIPDPNQENINEINQLNNQLGQLKDQWEDAITQLAVKNTQLIDTLTKTLFGGASDGSDGYIDVTAAYILEPTRQRSIINVVNIVFIFIIISMIVVKIK